MTDFAALVHGIVPITGIWGGGMSFVSVQPDLLATFATDLMGIRTTVGSANAAAATQITTLVAAAEDEISAAAAALFSGHGQAYLEAVNMASALHKAFERALASAALAYAETEVANAASAQLTSIAAPIRSLLGGASGLAGIGTAAAGPVALIMGGSGMPNPSQYYINAIQKYIAFPFNSALGVYTPESLYPLTGYNTMTLRDSVAQGVALLDAAIKAQIAEGNSVTVLGYSQSAIISSLEMNSLAAEGNPHQGQITFTLLGSPMNPNGGLMSRFAGLSFPSIGFDFYGATPADTPYETNIVWAQYDGYADFPRYPINFVSNLNAMAGILFVHGAMGAVDPFNLPAGFNLVSMPTSSADLATNYYMITYPGLPLLVPLRAIPFIGNPLADLVQPTLTYLVNWGYGDPHYGYSPGYADVPTGFGLLPEVNPLVFAADLVSTAGQGVNAFMGHIVGGVSSLANPAGAMASVTMPPVTSASVSSASVTPAVLGSAAALFPDVGSGASGRVQMLTPMADLAAAAFISVPQYGAALFADGMQQFFAGDPMGLVNAVGRPVAATNGLWTFLGTWAIATFLSEL